MSRGIGPTRLRLQVFAFQPQTFRAAIAQSCGLADYSVPPQVEYLQSFLSSKELKTKTIILESPYTDRHYTEEYRSYYSTLFNAPPQQTTRLHFFQDNFDQAAFEQLIADAATGDTAYSQVSKRLNKVYLGFVVIRPLPSAPIGRTVLRPYGKVSSRWYVQPVQRVHLAGIELHVTGVPFQQQEVAVGVCATTAIWVALAAAARASGHKSPTPNQITEAATRHVLTNRATPADGGLDLSQVLESIRASGYEPYLIKPTEQGFSVFTLALKCYLRSNIPAVLLLSTQPQFHAVTLVGYRTSDDDQQCKPLELACTTSAIKSNGITKFYVHEDRLGPYTRMKWLSPESHGAAMGEQCDLPALQHEPYTHDRYEYSSGPMGVYAAIVPLNSKLRLSALGLLTTARELRSMIRMLFGQEADDNLFMETKFVQSGEYVRELLRLEIATPMRAMRIATKLTFPRYVGIIRFFIREKAVCDIVCDTSDVLRTQPSYAPVIALINFNKTYITEMKRLARQIIPHAVVM